MPNPFLNILEVDYSNNDSEQFDLLVNELYKKYDKAKSSSSSLEDFELIKSEFKVRVARRFGFKDISNGKCSLLEVQSAFRYNTNSKYDRRPIVEELRSYPFCFFKHNSNLGHVVIRPETIADKISEIFQSVDIDFKNQKVFSFKYFVTADNKQLVKENLPEQLMEVLKSKNGISLELIDNYCLIRNAKAINIKNGMELCETALEIQRVLSLKN